MTCPSLLVLKNNTVVSRPSQGWHSGCSLLLLAICYAAIGSCKCLFVCFLLHSSCKSFLPCSGCDLWLIRGLVKITLKGMGSTNLLVKQPVSHLFIRAGRSPLGNHSSVPLNSHPHCLWHSSGGGVLISGVGWLIVCLQRPGLAKGGAEGTLLPCVQTLSF